MSSTMWTKTTHHRVLCGFCCLLLENSRRRRAKKHLNHNVCILLNAKLQVLYSKQCCLCAIGPRNKISWVSPQWEETWGSVMLNVLITSASPLHPDRGLVAAATHLSNEEKPNFTAEALSSKISIFNALLWPIAFFPAVAILWLILGAGGDYLSDLPIKCRLCHWEGAGTVNWPHLIYLKHASADCTLLSSPFSLHFFFLYCLLQHIPASAMARHSWKRIIKMMPFHRSVRQS